LPEAEFGYFQGYRLDTPRVCVIDDDETFRGSLTDLLRSDGYIVTPFGTAEEFLASPQCNEADGIVADIEMPGISGLEMTKNLRERGVGTPIIMVTGHFGSHLRDEAKQAGAQGFFQKPFEAADFLQRLHDLMASTTRARAVSAG
jgi:FixJ family two-component response regulator